MIITKGEYVRMGKEMFLTIKENVRIPHRNPGKCWLA